MPLLSLREVNLDFGGPKIFDNIELHIEAKERIALIGRNGEGKSTLLKLVAGELDADSGFRELPQGTRLAYLTQDVPVDLKGRVFDIVAAGVPDRFNALKAYHDAQSALSTNASETNLKAFEATQSALETVDGWVLEQQIETLLSKLSMDADARFEDLSGGKKRRVLLARALVQNPHVLILDEPTNHLDIASIDFLERLLKSFAGTVLFVTHDRRFMQNLATRIIELDRGSLTSWSGDYENYLRRLEERENAENLENTRFDKKLAEEEVWIRQGIKARRKRNEGRVRALKAMRETAEGRRKKQGTARINVLEAEESGRVVARLRNINYAWGDTPFVKDFSLKIMRSEKIGILGPNGCGKSTLINLILGRLPPDSGSIKLAQNLEIAYADQLRSSLQLERTVIDNIADGAKNVVIDGREVDVMAYLASFMFKAERMRQPVNSLSGGERNRLLLAKLFTKKANLMVLDEPTNDLDIETLEVLEEKLVNYTGTLLVVSHDRDFLDNISTRTLVFEGGAQVGAYIGGYHDWLAMLERTGKPNPLIEANKSESTRVLNEAEEQTEAIATKDGAVEQSPSVVLALKKKKLSYKDKRELDALPEKMEHIEAQMTDIQSQLTDPALYKDHPKQAAELGAQLKSLEDELAAAFERWEALESN